MRIEPPSLPVALLLGILAATMAPVVLAFSRLDPIIYVNPTVINSPVRVGDKITVEFATHRRSVCRAQSDNFIIKMPETKVLWRQRIDGISARPGVQVSQIDLDVKLPPGNYVYRSFIYSDCNGFLSTYVENDAPFEVVE